MHIIYAVSACSDKTYRKLFGDAPVKPSFQSQKYHRVLIEGFAANTKIDVVANPPVNRSVMDKSYIPLAHEEEAGAQYHYISAFRNPVFKLAAVAVGTFFRTLFMAKKDSAVIVDVLNRTTALFALLAAKIRGCRCVGIIMDLPDMFQGESSTAKKMANYVIKNCTDYVFLTESMNGYIQNPGKPYVVLEGHADISMVNHLPSMERKIKPAVVLYAGGVYKQYGLEQLVQGFQKAGISNTQLHIYGQGDYVEELKQIAQTDSTISYGGMLMNDEVVQKEMEATLLVNPRPTHEEYVKYSFPSKTMEYMASGTPVLTTVLPGMPLEYHPHVFLIHEESAEGIAQALKEVFRNSEEELFKKGLAARNFVLTERNNAVQAKKILDMLSK